MIFFALAGLTESSSAVGHRGRKAGQSMKKLSDNKKLSTPTKPTRATGASLKPLRTGCIEDKTPSQQIFIGGLPGRPPKDKK
jgi:hypothetical protein